MSWESPVAQRISLGRWALAVLTSFVSLAALGTWLSYKAPPVSLNVNSDDGVSPQLLDRHGRLLAIRYQDRWNYFQQKPLYEVPEFLRAAFLFSEDRRFFQHRGVDWQARAAALWQNLRRGRIVRGASTISEQVVRLWHPRPRTVWSRWLEGFESQSLERRFGKQEILEFYLNQIPYSRHRRGVVQAARLYFGRDLDTLDATEMLALVVMARAPSLYDPYRKTGRATQLRLEAALKQLADGMRQAGHMTVQERGAVLAVPLAFQQAPFEVAAPHFVRYAMEQTHPVVMQGRHEIRTSLDSELQAGVSSLLRTRLLALRSKGVHDAAVLVVDHQSGNEILAWASEHQGDHDGAERYLDAIRSPRQPGSTLKPFVYAMALEKGWTAATLLEDEPWARPVGSGLHQYRNFSREYYGALRLRNCLGNSLNIPAVKALAFIGVPRFYQRLVDLGVSSLRQEPAYYGEGLALGNAEISLFEMVQAYTALARAGQWQPLQLFLDYPPQAARRVFTPEASSLISDILADPSARRLEFGNGNLLRFPVQTAVKTGTSSAYYDAWAFGYSDHFTVGVWMGNLERSPMIEVSGAIGPALVLRAVFHELRKRDPDTQPLFLSPRLQQVQICAHSGLLPGPHCPVVLEWFEPDHKPQSTCGRDHQGAAARAGLSSADLGPARLTIRMPTPGLYLAMDPRIPDEREAITFQLSDSDGIEEVAWWLDGTLLASTQAARYLWRLQRGRHTLYAVVREQGKRAATKTPVVGFLVK